MPKIQTKKRQLMTSAKTMWMMTIRLLLTLVTTMTKKNLLKTKMMIMKRKVTKMTKMKRIKIKSCSKLT